MCTISTLVLVFLLSLGLFHSTAEEETRLSRALDIAFNVDIIEVDNKKLQQKHGKANATNKGKVPDVKKEKKEPNFFEKAWYYLKTYLESLASVPP